MDRCNGQGAAPSDAHLVLLDVNLPRSNYRSLAMMAVMTATTVTAFGTSLSLKYFVSETMHLQCPWSYSGVAPVVFLFAVAELSSLLDYSLAMTYLVAVGVYLLCYVGINAVTTRKFLSLVQAEQGTVGEMAA